MMVKGDLVNTYYTSQKQKLLRDFEKNTHKYGRKILASHYGEDFANTILTGARQEYEALIPQLPYIGGKRNFLLTTTLVLCTWDLALYKSLKNHGKTAEEAGRMAYEGVEAQLQSYPRFLLHLVGRLWFCKFWWRRQAAQSQKRRYAGDWVFTFVEGDGQEFDFGIDYAECAICKFFHAQGADEFTPYLCLGDYPMAKAMDTGLVRTMTVAGGAEKCDFRFKRGREVREAWPPKFLKPIGK